MTQRDDDLRMLGELLDKYADELSEYETTVFASMRFDLTAYPTDIRDKHGFRQLSDKQRAWVMSVHERVSPDYMNLVSRGLVPRGKEVPTPPILQNLPKKPPPRRPPEDT